MIIKNVFLVCRSVGIKNRGLSHLHWVWLLIFFSFTSHAWAAIDPIDTSAQEQLLQQERERALRNQQESMPDVRLPSPTAPLAAEVYPQSESPCFVISKIQLVGDAASQFQFALSGVTHGNGSGLGRCLGTQSINVVMTRVQNAMVARGYVTSRVLAAPQDLSTGELTLTVIPGRVRQIRFAADASPRGTKWNAIPMAPGEILNLRDIEQGLENLKRPPTAEADFQIEPAQGADAIPVQGMSAKCPPHCGDLGAKPGESDVVIRYQQRFPFRLSFSADDGGYDTTGKYQGGVTLSGDNLLTLNDLFYVNYSHDLGGGDKGSRGSNGNTVHYSLPYGYWLFGATASDYDYHQAVAGANQSYVYSGHSQNMEIKASRLIYRNAINKTVLSLGSFFRKSSNFINDTEIEVQRRRTAGWQLGFDQTWYVGKALLDYNIGYRRGTGALGALRAPEEAFHEGTSRMEVITSEINFNLPFSTHAPWGDQLLRYATLIRAQSNLTPLAPQDRFAIGNRYTVRGFDGQLTLSADRGWFIRNDVNAALGNTGQSLYVGLDYGEVGGQSSATLLGKQLAGEVIGLRGGSANRFGSFSYDVFAGQPIKKPDGFKTAQTTAGFNLNWSF